MSLLTKIQSLAAERKAKEAAEAEASRKAIKAQEEKQKNRIKRILQIVNKIDGGDFSIKKLDSSRPEATVYRGWTNQIAEIFYKGKSVGIVGLTTESRDVYRNCELEKTVYSDSITVLTHSNSGIAVSESFENRFGDVYEQFENSLVNYLSKFV